MRFEFKPSFDRSVKSFHGKEKEEIRKVAIQTIDILSQDRIIHKGIGLKHLRANSGKLDMALKRESFLGGKAI